MYHNSVTSLPKGLILTLLDLSYNNLKKLPDGITETSISELDLSYNKLTSLEDLTKSVSSLDVSGNFISEISDRVASLMPRDLNLNYNYLPCARYAKKGNDWYFVKQNCDQSKQYNCSSKTVSECDELKNNYGICTPNSKRTKCFRYTSGVKEFCDFAADAGIEDCEEIYSNEGCTDTSEYHGFVYDCGYDCITKYQPKDMSEFLTEIPTSASKLTNLSTLDLSNLGLTSLSKSYANFKDVRYFDLSKNRLTTLPAELGNMKKLSCLNISYNQLTSLPTTIGSLTSLRKLDVSRNKLDALPDVFDSLPSLSFSSLYIKHNSLSTISDSFKNYIIKSQVTSL